MFIKQFGSPETGRSFGLFPFFLYIPRGDSNPEGLSVKKTCRGHVFSEERKNRYRREAEVVFPIGRMAAGRPDGSPETGRSFGLFPFFCISWRGFEPVRSPRRIAKIDKCCQVLVDFILNIAKPVPKTARVDRLKQRAKRNTRHGNKCTDHKN